MKSKLFVAFAAIVISLVPLLLVAVANGQTPLDPTQSGAYPIFSANPAVPAYIDHSCGGVAVTQYGETGDTAAFRFSTVCPGSGRGAKPTVYVACWAVTFAADRYAVLERDQLLAMHWKLGAAPVPCPGL